MKHLMNTTCSLQDDGELRLQRILQSLKGIADLLPDERSQQPWQNLSPPRLEEQAAASGFQRAVLRMFGSSNQVSTPCLVAGMHTSQYIPLNVWLSREGQATAAGLCTVLL